MNRLLAIMVALVGIVLSDVPQVQAQYYGNSHTAGYTYRDGYWWNNAGLAFTRTSVAYRYQQGCCWYTGYKYEYQPVQLNPYEDDATQQLLRIAAARDKVEGQIRVQSNSHNMFLEKLKALGMEGNFRWNGYGYQLQMATGAGFGHQAYSQQETNYQPYAQQGNTVYGYSQFTSPYGNVDMTLALKQAKDLAQNAQQLAGSGSQQYMEYLTNMADGQSRVAEIMAKAELLKVAEPKEGSRSYQSLSFRAHTDGNGQIQVEKLQDGNQAGNTESLYGILQQRCVSCHGPTKKDGNVDMTNFLSFTVDQQRRVIELITTPDGTKRMPKRADGAPGDPLGLEEVITIIKHTK